MKQFNKEKALRKLNRKKTKEQRIQFVTLIVSCVTMIVGIMFFAFAKFESEKEYTLIKGKIGDFQSGDYVIGAYIDGEKSRNIPAKESGYYLQKVECDNGAVGTWDSISWSLTVENVSAQTKCYVYFTTTIALADTSGDYSTTLKNYPIGSIYTSTSSTNPSTLFGGTWERYGQGRTLISAGKGTDSNNESKTFSVGTTGGEYNHKLVVSEIPSHNHISLKSFEGATNDYLGGSASDYGTVPGSSSSGISNFMSSFTGGDGSHNNIQPYIVVYMWRRTA